MVGTPRNVKRPGKPSVPLVDELWVADEGSGSERSASTTCWPAVSPCLISVHVSPTVPTVTETRRVSPPSSTSTVWRFPKVVTAEVGTARADVAFPVTIETVPVDPFRRLASLRSSPTITRYVGVPLLALLLESLPVVGTTEM